MKEPKHAAAYPHYYRPVGNLTHVDVYRVLELFGVTSPHLQHAVKKLLVAGHRGAKDQAKDVREAIVTLERWEEMRAEDASVNEVQTTADQSRRVLARDSDLLPGENFGESRTGLSRGT